MHLNAEIKFKAYDAVFCRPSARSTTTARQVIQSIKTQAAEEEDDDDPEPNQSETSISSA